MKRQSNMHVKPQTQGFKDNHHAHLSSPVICTLVWDFILFVVKLRGLASDLLCSTNFPTLDRIRNVIYSRFCILTTSIIRPLSSTRVTPTPPNVWLSVLITETSRGLTQFVNPRAPLSASLLRSPLCRAKSDPFALGGSDAGGKEQRGELVRGCQPALGPHVGTCYAGDGQQGREGGEVIGVVGAQAGHSAGKGAMCQSVKALAQPGGLFSLQSRQSLHF